MEKKAKIFDKNMNNKKIIDRNMVDKNMINKNVVEKIETEKNAVWKNVMEKNTILEVRINSVTDDGMGVAKIKQNTKDYTKDFVIFVIDAITNDFVRIKILKKKKNYAIAKVIKLLECSNLSVVPFDKYFGRSGGCSVSRMDYSYQLLEKMRIVKDCIERIGGFDLKKIDYQKIEGMSRPFHYRNKAIYPCGINQRGEADFGYYKPRSHDISFEHSSIIEHPANAGIIEKVKKWANQHKISVYDENAHSGIIRNLIIRISQKNDVMIAIGANCDELPFKDELVSILLSLNEERQVETVELQNSAWSDCEQNPVYSDFEEKTVWSNGIKSNTEKNNFNLCKNKDDLKNKIKIVSILHNIQKERGNALISSNSKVLYGNDKLIDFIGDLEFKLSLASFFQINAEQTLKLYKKVLEYADLKGDENLWDIYCGAGTISLFLARFCKFVRGNEYVQVAVENAFENAKRNNIQNVDFEAGAAENIIPDWLEKYESPDVIVLDPPRKGADRRVLEAILSAAPEKIVYVSCNPATLARDLKILCSNERFDVGAQKPQLKQAQSDRIKSDDVQSDDVQSDCVQLDNVQLEQTQSGKSFPKYEIKKMQAFDLFPHTMHVETIALLSKVDVDGVSLEFK